MTTRINIFNEGPGNVVVMEQEHDSENKTSWNRETVLFPIQGIETYIWKEKDILIKEQ